MHRDGELNLNSAATKDHQWRAC